MLLATGPPHSQSYFAFDAVTLVFFTSPLAPLAFFFVCGGGRHRVMRRVVDAVESLPLTYQARTNMFVQGVVDDVGGACSGLVSSVV